MSNDERLEGLLDQAIEEIRADRPSAEQVEQAAERVRARLRTATAAPPASDDHEPLRELDDYTALIPDYLAGRLSPARALLLEEEARRSIPLRRALQAAREGREAKTEAPRVGSERRWPTAWIAAAAVVLLALATAFLAPNVLPTSQAGVAQVAEIEGTLFRVEGDQLVPLRSGDTIDGREDLRTAKDSTAVLHLDDGSIVEVDERSTLRFVRQRQGDRILVDRGRIIVQAAEQGSGRLRVTTDDLRVAVKGTVFAVAHGTKGSRVSVIEGEVEVRQGRQRTSLLPGEQIGSTASLTTAAIEEDFAWGQDVDHYIELLQQLVELRRELNQLMAANSRYSTRLLDLAPADAAVYVAVPNATAKLAEAYELIRSKVASSGELADAWQEFQGSPQQQMIDGFFEHLRELSQYLGEETVIAVTAGEGGGPVVLSEILDPAAFRAALEQQLADLAATHAAEGGSEPLPIAIVESPSAALASGVSIWLVEDLLVAATSGALLEQVAAVLGGAPNPFTGSEFHGLLAGAYAEGAQFLGAVDLASLLDLAGDEDLEAIGLANARHLIVQRRQLGSEAETTAELSFEGERRGLASWLAEPGPMGALEFFSPDTTVVSAFVVRDPADLLDELLLLVAADGEDVQTALAEFERQTGLSLRDDVFAPLGGEFALGLDGPALPQPSWKLVFEVYDELRLQGTVEQLVARVNLEAAARGGDYALTLEQEDVQGRRFYTLSGEVPEDSGAAAFQGVMEAVWTYVDGYFVSAPTRTLVERAIQYYEGESSLVSASDFQALLPQDGYLDFSGVVFNRMGDMLAEFLDRLPTSQTLSAEQQQAVDELRGESGASLYCVYGERDRIRFVSHGPNELPLAGLSQVLGFGSVLGELGAATPFAELVQPAGVRFGPIDEPDPMTREGISWQ